MWCAGPNLKRISEATFKQQIFMNTYTNLKKREKEIPKDNPLKDIRIDIVQLFENQQCIFKSLMLRIHIILRHNFIVTDIIAIRHKTR